MHENPLGRLTDKVELQRERSLNKYENMARSFRMQQATRSILYPPVSFPSTCWPRTATNDSKTVFLFFFFFHFSVEHITHSHIPNSAFHSPEPHFLHLFSQLSSAILRLVVLTFFVPGLLSSLAIPLIRNEKGVTGGKVKDKYERGGTRPSRWHHSGQAGSA